MEQSFNLEFSRPHKEVEVIVIDGLRKALKTGAVRQDQVEEYIQAYKDGLMKKPPAQEEETDGLK